MPPEYLDGKHRKPVSMVQVYEEAHKSTFETAKYADYMITTSYPLKKMGKVKKWVVENFISCYDSNDLKQKVCPDVKA